jgi:DNA-binding MarR family transcriptional regulator
VGRPNSTETPNIPPAENRRPSPAAIDAVLDGYERLMHRLVVSHAPEFTEVSITMAQAKVLYVVMAAGRLRMSELAARLGIGSSSASELADRLVEMGLLQRNQEPDDRRQVVVSATTAAEALIERFRELNQRQLRELLEQLEIDELDVIDRSLEVFGRALDRRAAATDGRSTSTIHQGETHP